MTVQEFLETIKDVKVRIVICAADETVLIEVYKHENNYLSDTINAANITRTKIRNTYTVVLTTDIEVADEQPDGNN